MTMKTLNRNLMLVLLLPVLPLLAAAQEKGCSKLETIILPSTVTSIGDNALSVCSKLTSVECAATTPPTCASTTFNALTTGTYGAATLTVPTASASLYKVAPVWCKFAMVNSESTAVATVASASFAVTTGVFLLSPACISSQVSYTVSFYGGTGAEVKLTGLSSGDTATLTGTSAVTGTASQVGSDYQITFNSLAAGTYMLSYGSSSMKLVLYVYNN